MKKIIQFLILLFVFVSSIQSVHACEQTDSFILASFAVDTSGSSPQYIEGVDLFVLREVDNTTLTSSLLPSSINSSNPSFVFKFNGGYTTPSDEELKSLNLKMVYKTNVGTIQNHYIVVKSINNSNQRSTCVAQQLLSVPSVSGEYMTKEIDISECKIGDKVPTIEVYYYASALIQPVNISFDQIIIDVTHGNKDSHDEDKDKDKDPQEKPLKRQDDYVTYIDVLKNGGDITRDAGKLKIQFNNTSLPTDVKVDAEQVKSPSVVKPINLSSDVYKLNVIASLNGIPVPKFNPSMLYLSYSNACEGIPTIRTSTDGKNWKNLYSVKTSDNTHRAAAVIRNPGYYAVSCK